MYRSILIIVLLGLHTLAAQDLSSTIDSLKSEIEENPGSHELHTMLANCYYGLGNYTDALEEFRHAIELNPDDFASHFKVALCYYHLDSNTVARVELEKVRDMQPTNKHPYWWLGDTYGLLGMYDDMLGALEEYRSLCGKEYFHSYSTRDYYNVDAGVAQAYAMKGQYDQAIKCYKDAVDDYWGPYTFDIALAMIYANKGNSSEVGHWRGKAAEHVERYYRDFQKMKEDSLAFMLIKVHAYLSWLLGSFENAATLMDSLSSVTELDSIGIYNRCVYHIAAGDVHSMEDLKESLIHAALYSVLYDVLSMLRSDSLSEAITLLTNNEEWLRKSALPMGLYAYVLEQLGDESQATKWWYRCYGYLPLGIDVRSMRHFIDSFVATVKKIP
ncbi:MAG: tetratricopeptide repeat protein [candidate division WOR-3 bacterium]|nr:MAG: tetratricopeptide repeat protein [candidate division WOR-3 bacterium]